MFGQAKTLTLYMTDNLLERIINTLW